MKKAYYASPLFSDMERMYNEQVVAQVRKRFPDLDLFVPQEQPFNDKDAYADSMIIAAGDTKGVVASDVLIAVLDGQTIDVGVASEIGVAYQAGIPVVGLYTDVRQKGADNAKKIAALSEIAESQFSYVNLYTIGLIKLNGAVVATIDEMLEVMAGYLEK